MKKTWTFAILEFTTLKILPLLPILCALITGCTSSKQRGANITFSVDPILPTSLINTLTRNHLGGLRIDSPLNHARSGAPWAPSDITGFDCVFVNVMGTLIGDWTSNQATVHDNPGCGYLGTYSNLVSLTTGGTVTLSVLPGSARIVQVIGVRSNVGCSKSLDATTIAALDSYPGVFEVGRAVTDTFQDVDLTIDNTYSLSTARDFRCYLGSPPIGTDIIPPVISGAISGTPGSTSVALSWAAGTDNNSAVASLQYKVVRSSAITSIDTISTADAGTVVTDWTANLTSANVTGLSASTVYAFAVLVRDKAGNTTLYSPISVTTTAPDFASPVVGGNLNGSASQTSVSLSWKAATDNLASAASLEYKVVTAALTSSLITVELANAATIVTNWTANLTAATSSGLTGSTTYAYNVLVRDTSGNMSIYTPISLATSGSAETVRTVVSGIPTGEGSISISSNSGLNSGFFFNGAYYQPVRGSFDYLLKLNLTGTVDTTFGTQGYQKLATISGAPALTTGTTWEVCNGSAYFYWNNSDTYRLYRANLNLSPITITDLAGSTNSSGGVLYDLNCVGTKLVATWIVNSGTPSELVATYDTVSTTYLNSGAIPQATVSNIGAPFVDTLGNLWLFSFNHWFQQFDTADLSLANQKIWNIANNSLSFDGAQFSSTSDALFYGRAGGASVKLWTGTVANLMSLFVTGTATPSFTHLWGFTPAGNISDSRFCRFGNNYLGYANDYVTYPNYTFRAGVFNQSSTTSTLSPIFNGGNELVLNSGNYTFYTGRYYLSLACDDVNGRGAFAYTDTPNININLIDATASNTYLNALGVSVGTLYPSFSPTITNYSLTYKISEQATNINVTPTSAHSGATVRVKINGGAYVPVASGSASSSLTLSPGSNSISIQVTSVDGAIKTYNVTANNGICSAGYYDDGTHLCVESGVGYFSNGITSNRISCSNKPANSHYTSLTGTSSVCPWSCDAAYVSDGTSCDSYPNSAFLSCNDNEIAVGVNGRYGSIIDRLGLRCASYQNGQIISSTRNGPSYEGNGGGPFNSDGSLDCPVGYALYTVKGFLATYSGANRTGELQVRCVSLTDGTVFSSYQPGNSSYWGSTADRGAFNFQCGSSVNPGSSYINGLIIDNQGGSSYVGDILGISCR